MTSSYHDPHPHTGKIRAKLDGLIHRHNHAKFHVKMIIHQLGSVPLIEGEFAVRWKFRGVVKQKEKDTISSWKGKGRERSEEDSTITGTPLRMSPTNQSLESLDQDSSSDSNSRSNTHSSIAHSSNTHIPSQDSFGETIHYSSTDRGSTEYLPLTSHKVIYEHQVDVVLDMFVGPPGERGGTTTPSSSASNSRPHSPTKKSASAAAMALTSSARNHLKLRLEEPGMLVSSPLKLVVTQRRVKDKKTTEQETSAPPPNPRLGAVYLDLAEYADPQLGAVTRKYLLMESKTNAILMLTLQLTTLSAPSNGFTAPPLRSSTIQSSLSSLRPTFAHTNSSFPGSGASTPLRSETNIPATATTATATTPQGRRRLPPLAPRMGNIETTEETEALIDALFNPIVTMSNVETPFSITRDRLKTVSPPSSAALGSSTTEDGETPTMGLHASYMTGSTVTSASTVIPMTTTTTTSRSTTLSSSMSSLRRSPMTASTTSSSSSGGILKNDSRRPSTTRTFSTNSTTFSTSSAASSSSRSSSINNSSVISR